MQHAVAAEPYLIRQYTSKIQFFTRLLSNTFPLKMTSYAHITFLKSKSIPYVISISKLASVANFTI